MSGHHVKYGHGHGNVGTARSMWLRPQEYGIYGVKYVIVELEFRMSHCCTVVEVDGLTA